MLKGKGRVFLCGLELAEAFCTITGVLGDEVRSRMHLEPILCQPILKARLPTYRARLKGLMNFVPAVAYHFYLTACSILATWAPPFSRALYLKGRASSPQSARGKGKEAWRGGTVCMADGVLIGALSSSTNASQCNIFPFSGLMWSGVGLALFVASTCIFAVMYCLAVRIYR